MNKRVEVQWCTLCGARFTEDEIHNAKNCPKCGDKSIPCAIENDVQVYINWHELRILGIWASNYANTIEERDRSVIQAILQRVQRQYPDKSPLTLFAEIEDLKATKRISELKHSVKPNPLVPTYGPGAVK